MITKHVSLWYNIIYNMIKLLDNYLFYFAKICLKYTSSNMFWIVLLNKNLRTFWGWFVIKHPINKNSISVTSEIVCSYMRVFTVFQLTYLHEFFRQVSLASIFCGGLSAPPPSPVISNGPPPNIEWTGEVKHGLD